MRRIRACPSLAVRILPIALDGYASGADREATIAAGYQACVAKPFEPSDRVNLFTNLPALALTTNRLKPPIKKHHSSSVIENSHLSQDGRDWDDWFTAERELAEAESASKRVVAEVDRPSSAPRRRRKDQQRAFHGMSIGRQ